MKCLRNDATPDGESSFGEVDIPMTQTLAVAPGATPFAVSARYPAASVAFTHIPAGMRQVAWHTVPARVLTVRLTGAVDYETSDGAMRHVPAGLKAISRVTRRASRSFSGPGWRVIFRLDKCCHPQL